jgi:hypothetical protein
VALTVRLTASVHAELQAEAERRGVTIAVVARERISPRDCD